MLERRVNRLPRNPMLEPDLARRSKPARIIEGGRGDLDLIGRIARLIADRSPARAAKRANRGWGRSEPGKTFLALQEHEILPREDRPCDPGRARREPAAATVAAAQCQRRGADA